MGNLAVSQFVKIEKVLAPSRERFRRHRRRGFDSVARPSLDVADLVVDALCRVLLELHAFCWTCRSRRSSGPRLIKLAAPAAAQDEEVDVLYSLQFRDLIQFRRRSMQLMGRPLISMLSFLL